MAGCPRCARWYIKEYDHNLHIARRDKNPCFWKMVYAGFVTYVLEARRIVTLFSPTRGAGGAGVAWYQGASLIKNGVPGGHAWSAKVGFAERVFRNATKKMWDISVALSHVCTRYVTSIYVPDLYQIEIHVSRVYIQSSLNISGVYLWRWKIVTTTVYNTSQWKNM